MNELLDFLRELRRHNDKEWFDAHRKQYAAAREYHRQLTERLIEGIASFDPSVCGLRPQDCTYRIHRDTRFSADKSPYKTWMGIFVAPRGKKSGYGGYYFHIDPDGEGAGHHQLIAGVYMPEGPVLRSIRDEILDNGAEIAQALREAEGFRLYEGNKLKRMPKGYAEGGEYDEWLKLKEFWVGKPLKEEELLDRELVRRVVEEFRRTHHLIEILNRAVRFAYEEMM